MKIKSLIIALFALLYAAPVVASGPLVSKTLTENFLNIGSTWNFYYQTYLSYDTNGSLITAPSYNSTEGALWIDSYPNPSCGYISQLQLHNGYPAILEVQVKVPSSTPNYWSGPVMWVSQQNYSMLAITDINGPSSPTAYPGQNENLLATNYYANNSGLTYPATTLNAYHDVIVVYTGASSYTYNGVNLAANTAAYWMDGNYIGSHAQTQLDHTPLALIVANNANSTHTGSYFKNLTASGVFVLGFPQLLLNNNEINKLLPINNGLQGSPELDNVTTQYLNNGIELAYSTGWHQWTAESTSITSNAGDGTGIQSGGTFALSGDAITGNYYPPPQFSGWNQLQWNANYASGTISVQVCDSTGTPLPNSIIPGNSSTINLATAGSYIDLSGVNAATYPTLRFHIYETSTTTASSPILYNLFTTFSTSSDSLTYNVALAPTLFRIKNGYGVRIGKLSPGQSGVQIR